MVSSKAIFDAGLRIRITLMSIDLQLFTLIYLNADPDLDPFRSAGNLRPLAKDTPGLHFEPPGSIVSVHGSIWSL